MSKIVSNIKWDVKTLITDIFTEKNKKIVNNFRKGIYRLACPIGKGVKEVL